jgi:CHAD domain-containing protein
MREVLAHHRRAARVPDMRAVHRLRKSLRRCRTLASGLQAVAPAPEWHAMLEASRTLFKSLGGLRDTHVLNAWLTRLAPADDPVARVLRYHLNAREIAQAATVSQALQHFDRAAWRGWNKHLARHAARHPPGSAVFEHLALQRLQAAHALHRTALKGGSRPAWHRLRIGIKQLRYAVENFLPELQHTWGTPLGELQDELGDMHDLDVLRDELYAAHLLDASGLRASWEQRIEAVREARLASYRARTVGAASLWVAWRRELCTSERMARATRAALSAWAAHHGSDQVRGARLEEDLEAALARLPRNAREGLDWPLALRIAPAAARLHGLAGTPHTLPRKAALARVQEMPLPLGWCAADRSACAVVVAQFRRPRFKATLPGYTTLAPDAQRTVQYLAALLGRLYTAPGSTAE